MYCCISQINTVELHLSRLIGTVSQSGYAENPDNWIFFFENRLHWEFEVEKKSTNGYFRLHVDLLANETLIHNSLHLLVNWRGGGDFSRKICSTIKVRKCLP